jgi:integrase
VYGNTTDSRLPITPSLLRLFHFFLNLSYPDHLTLWGAILLAFFAFLRSGELLSLHHSDRRADGYQVHIKQSKTDPFHSGAVVTVLPSGDLSLSAVTALDSYIVTQGPPECTLFRLKTAALTRQRLNHLIRPGLAVRSRVTASSNSFRIGAASAAAAAGIPDLRIH